MCNFTYSWSINMRIFFKIFLFLALLTTYLPQTNASFFEQIRHGIVPNYCDMLIPGLIEFYLTIWVNKSDHSLATYIAVFAVVSFLNHELYEYLYSNTRQGLLDQKRSIILQVIPFINKLEEKKISIIQYFYIMRKDIKNDFIETCIVMCKDTDIVNNKLLFLKEPPIDAEIIQPFRDILNKHNPRDQQKV